MFYSIKNYFAQKKKIRELLLDTLEKANHTAAALAEITDLIKALSKEESETTE